MSVFSSFSGILLKALRFGLTGVWFGVVSLSCLPLFLVRWKNPDNNRIFCRFLAVPLMRLLGLKVEIRGRERMNSHQPCVFVANHRSNFDIVIYSLIYPRRTVSVGKRSIGYIPVFGWLFTLGGHLLVNRSDSRNTMKAMRSADDVISKEGTSIWFFPEGTRNRGGELGPFKKGAFVCAARNGVPLVSIVASRPSGNLDFGRWRAGTLRLEVLEPLLTTPADLENLEALMNRVRSGIQEGLARST